VNTFFEDKDGIVWIGTGDGTLNKLINHNNFIKFPLKNVSTTHNLLGIISGGSKNLYITGWGIGLYEFNTITNTFTDRMKYVKTKGNSPSKNIKGLSLDSKGNVWLATHNEFGLFVYDPQKDSFYNATSPGPFNKDLLSVPYPLKMQVDNKKRIWIASCTGLYMFDSIFHAYKSLSADSSTLSSDYTYTLFEDHNGQIWIGNSNGLDKMIEKDGKIKFERMGYKYPIPNNIKGILQDKKGYLWLSSNLELTQFHPESKKIKHFKINRDLPSQEFFERSCLMSSSGEMYFGGSSGFFRFIPDSISNYKSESKVYIIDFLLFNKPQSPNTPASPLKKSILETKVIELKYDQSVISFEYVAPNFDQFKSFNYAYKMEGFDKDWYYSGEKRSVTYTNLPQGEYIFKVTTVDGNEPLSENYTEIRIKIHPPFWRTNLAYSVYFAFILFLMYLFRWVILNREKLRNEIRLEKINIKNIRENELMKMRFFTNISHEFRTPLTLIKGPLEKLSDSSNKTSVEDRNYYLKLIHTNTDRLINMVNQLMDYRKLEAGSLVLEPSQGDIVEFCRNTWAAFSLMANQKHIQYTFQSQIESLNMDKIISNLLSNAFKFTADYGLISLSIAITKNEMILESFHPEILEITIKDNGIGISEMNLPHIFERFYSVSKTINGKTEGTGIGLALVKELTELHKGRITVQSTDGEGAEFIIHLPLISHDYQKQNGALHEQELRITFKTEIINSDIDKTIDGNKDAKRYKILIVEDDDELRIFIKKELQKEYDLLLAKNGDEGLRMAFFDIPDLILSDVMMPKMDGFELCKTIKEDERTSHIPIILLTARHSQEKQFEGFEAGADDYILKPFSLELLKIRIRNLITIRQEIIEKFKHGTSLNFNDERIENKDRILLQSFIDLILENINNENLNADFIANKMNISRSVVYIKIEALSGQTVNEFIRNIRLKKSIRFLGQDSLSISEIAYEVGFTSHSYFTRSFTKHFGISPKDYMAQNRNNNLEN
jgi:signal transduction histidine kinase/DNA-binding response OmpR family regulator